MYCIKNVSIDVLWIWLVEKADKDKEKERTSILYSSLPIETIQGLS